MRRILFMLGMLLMVTSLLTTPASALSVTVKVEKATYGVGEKVIVIGMIDQVTRGFDVTIRVNSPRGNAWALDQVTPNLDGSFSASLGPISNSDAQGNYTVLVTYRGISAEARFSVSFEKKPSTTGITLGRNSINFQEEVVLNVQVDPKVSNGTIKIEYSTDGSSWSTGIEDNLKDGVLQMVWKPPYPGNFLTRATWVGNNNYSPSTSPSVNLEVKPVRVPIPVKWEQRDFQAIFDANSAISDFTFDQPQKRITFSPKGPPGGPGSATITIPLELLNGEFTILANGQPTPFTRTKTDTATILTLQYQQNSKVEIIGTTAIPEYPFAAPILAMILAGLLLLSIRSRRAVLTVPSRT